MVLIELRFPAGRYHATPWGRHVNEGAVEWPPSPWRLLRALLAVCWRKCPDLQRERVEPLINKLAASAPRYALPRAVGAHTRHYMPPYKGNNNKVFDAFLHLGRQDKAFVCWPDLTLDESERTVLARLVEGVGYLGRAESWTEGRLLGEDASPPEFNAAVPMEPGAPPPAGREAEWTLGVMDAETYTRWRTASHDEELAKRERRKLEEKQERARKKGKDPAREKLTPKEKTDIKAALVALFPATLFDALHAETGTLQAQGWSLAPGAQRVVYHRPAVRQSSEASVPAWQTGSRPTTLRLALAPDTVRADTRPRLRDALYLGEQTRRALMHLSRRAAEEEQAGDPQCAAIFSGKDPRGHRLDDNHEHAFFLPCDEDGDGRIDHIILYARPGFSQQETDVAARLRNLWQHGGRPGLHVVYLGEGHPADFGGFKRREGHSPFLAASCVWRSSTPYVPTRHPKRNKRGEPRRDESGNWIDSPEMQLRRELALRGLPDPVHIEVWAPGNNPAAWRHFATRRKHGAGARARDGGMGFRITFAEPLCGPLALGYGCHFGLGLFVAEPGTGAALAPGEQGEREGRTHFAIG